MAFPPKWRILSFNKESVEEIKKRYNFSSYFSKVLIDRGMKTPEEIKKILSPGFESLYPPSLLPDIEIGFDRINKAIKNGEGILIWGDEDTDGVTATVFLFELLRNLNARVFYHIPKRKEEGIGLNISGIKKVREMGCSLIITVDCCSSDKEKIQEAKRMGIDVVVTDHHEVLIDKVQDFPLINPKRNDSLYPFRDIAGVTVAFKLGWFIAEERLSLKNKEWESDIKDWLPLIFLGTYADRVPLKDENWLLSRLGFNAIQDTKRVGIKILTKVICGKGNCDEGMLQKMISVLSTAKTESWTANLGFKILTEKNEDWLTETITYLLRESEEWRRIANRSSRQLLASVKNNVEEGIIFVYEPKIPYDYLGFCASRLRERLYRPVVITTDKDNYIIGEARAPQDFDIHKILSEKKHLFLSFGGHKPACGFTMEKKNLDSLRKSLEQYCSKVNNEDLGERETRIVDILPLEKITTKIRNEITLLSPFGTGNPPPLFLAQNVSLSKGVYTYDIPNTGQSKRIEMKSDYQTWVGIDGKPVTLDIIYYINSAGIPTIADARPSLFNEPMIQT